MSVPQKLAYQVTRVTKNGEENAGLYFDRIIAEDRLGWWEKRDPEGTYRVDDKLLPEDQWHRLRAAAHLCDPVAILEQKK